MKKIYLFCLFFLVLVFVYLLGVRFGAERAKRVLAEQNLGNYNDIIKIQEKINAESFNRGADDIRNILRKNYTITE